MVQTVDALKEADDKIRDLKRRNSDLSRDNDLAGRKIKALQDKVGQVHDLEADLAATREALDAANRQNALLVKNAEETAVNTSQDAKRAAAFLAIRAALETK